MSFSLTDSVFSTADRVQLAERGVSLEEALAQLARIARPPGAIVIDRPCTVGDGIHRLTGDASPAFRARHEAAVAAGRYTAFIPASGAATRMFRDLLAWRERPGELPLEELETALASGSSEARAVRDFLEGLPRFAFREEIARGLAAHGQSLDSLARSGPLRPVLDVLLGEDGLDFARRPKGLIPFHRDGDHGRTAFEEHLVEAAHALADARRACRLHATVSPEHVPGFAAALDRARGRFESALGCRFEVGLSVQSPATDTLALASDGRPFRDIDGRLLFRPAGHGALLHNLSAMGGDLVFIKNVDNVAAESHKAPTYEWFARLSGVLLDHEHRLREVLSRLEEAPDAGAVREALAFARDLGGATPPADVPPAELARWLDRPLRVCGMVPNMGEPGGGPFWVRGPDGRATCQIVESSQIRSDDPDQRALFTTSTHFNPVFIVGSLRDRRGRPHDLTRFVDPDAAIVTRKSFEGRMLAALERPGLWNGAMSGWHTVFVEVPLAVFNPVKTVHDLLRWEHQPG